MGAGQYPLERYFVPQDDRLLPAARVWAKSDDPMARCMAAGIFGRYPDPQDRETLKALLADSFIVDMPLWLSPWSGREYVVRESAWRALDRRGKSPAVPSVDLPLPRLYQPVSVVWPVLWIVMLLGVFLTSRTAKQMRFRQLPRSWLHHAAASISFVCVVLAVAAAFAWHRSTRTADDFVYARGGTLLDIAAVQGNVYIEWGRSWPDETNLVHAAITPDPLDLDRLNRDANFRHRFGTGDMDNYGSLWDCYVGHQYQRPWLFDADFSHVCVDWPAIVSGRPTSRGWIVACAYPYLIALLLTFPVSLFLLGRMVHVWQRRNQQRRIKRGLCANCAYDLRAHVPGDYCPECGHVIATDHDSLKPLGA